MREGWRAREDDRPAFEAMRRQFYTIRGWNPETGLQERDLLDRLEMSDVAAALADRDLIGS